MQRWEEIEDDEVEAFRNDENDIDFFVESVCDGGIVKEFMQNLAEGVVQTDKKNLLLGCINSKLDVDVLFLDRIMNTVENEETSAPFTPFSIKMKQICNNMIITKSLFNVGCIITYTEKCWT